MKTQPLLLSTSPFLKDATSTPFIMWQVVFTLVPVVLAATYYFGISALLVTGACVAGAILTEWVFTQRTIRDGSAMITGILLALTLPPGIPLWMAFVGGVASIGLGKLIFGGIGYNVFNPALVGRAFLQAAFPVSLTTWSPQGNFSGFWEVRGANFALPFMTSTGIDATTAATPLAMMKWGNQPTGMMELFLGNTAGSLGETCAVVILMGGLYLAVRNLFNWRIPVSIFATVFILASVLHLLNPEAFPPAIFHLLSGGLVLGAVFMATDMVTSPVTPLGCWIFGIGIGILVIVIREFGGLPEGVMYSILLMNAATPIINRLTQPRIYGAVKETQ
ncbi:MAG: RnfABCDGE type electron transport complex subunit D [Gemmatimonadetes bacterium]|nr:MAG: RnfABCDGE type electron transport complex subunit D [Gemmatimonadota bacterium]